MDANNFKIIKAKKIQNFYRSYKINSVINDLRNLDLKALGSSIPFSEFTIVMRKKEIINGSKLFINNLSKMTKIKVDVSNRVLLSAYLINYYAEEILDQEKNRHPIDSGILEWSQELINQLEDKEYKNFSEFKKLCLYLNNYKNIFNQWKYMDKNRTIERIIISYNNRSEHIEEIKKHKDLNEEQRKLALNELEFQRSELTVDTKKSFDKLLDSDDGLKNFKLSELGDDFVGTHFRYNRNKYSNDDQNNSTSLPMKNN